MRPMIIPPITNAVAGIYLRDLLAKGLKFGYLNGSESFISVIGGILF